MTELINEATYEAYAIGQWEYHNEAEFKFELFHKLANKKVDGKPLSEKCVNSPTSIHL
ncbi:MAG: hypothetical protein IPH57_05115 [Saprospiraceae bacterium]|nr:hypothetical protein [Saprospiraceae bacterium]